MSIKKWRTIHSSYIVQDKWLTLRADRCKTADGMVIDPYYVIEESGWVNIVALDSNQRILILRQYRQGSGAICSELPAGAIDKYDASPLVAAKRELMEETGCMSEQYVALESVFANPGRQNNLVHGFIAFNTRCVCAPTPDKTEDIDFEFVDLDMLLELIDSGQFAQSLHITTLFLAFRKLRWLSRLDALGFCKA